MKKGMSYGKGKKAAAGKKCAKCGKVHSGSCKK
jgi:hypothetical protein